MRRNLKMFNMVEIILALGVSAIGVAAIMGLLPVALRSSNDAMADSYVADVGSTALARCDEWFTKQVTSKTAPSDTDFSTYASWFPEAPPALPTASAPPSPVPSNAAGRYGFDGVDYNHYRVWFRTLSDAEYPEFDAEVRIWRENLTEADLKIRTESDTLGSGDLSDTYLRLVIEVSWPVTLAGTDRNKRYFVREYVNPAKIKKD